MISENYYYYIQSAFSERFCDDVVNYCLSQNDTLGITGKFNENLNLADTVQLKTHRNSNVVWVDEPWITKEIMAITYEVNKMAGWNYDLSFQESPQFTKYAPGQFYDWHCDSAHKTNDKGLIRKLRLSISLSKPEEYTDGLFQFDYRDYDPRRRDPRTAERSVTEILPRGSVLFFPSWVWHRVKPVTSGIRYSLVNWIQGTPYR